MAGQGSGGAYEISQRMTAMLGWGATVDFKEDWTWDQAAQTYALDPAMAERLRRANPQVQCGSERSPAVPEDNMLAGRDCGAVRSTGGFLRRHTILARLQA